MTEPLVVDVKLGVVVSSGCLADDFIGNSPLVILRERCGDVGFCFMDEGDWVLG